MNKHYQDVTELSGEPITLEQLQRLCNRYYWAGQYRKDKDVLEVACGVGPGLGYLSKLSNSLIGGDISDAILSIARLHYKGRVDIRKFDACSMPFLDHSFDVILIFEAIYYLQDIEQFMRECKRVLRPNGTLLIVTANKDLYDFHPSSYSYSYFGIVELKDLLTRHNFKVKFYGETSIKTISLKQKILRPIKKIASKAGLIPQSMQGKKWLKRIVFGKLVSMPAEIDETTAHYQQPDLIVSEQADKTHKVIFCLANLKD